MRAGEGDVVQIVRNDDSSFKIAKVEV